VLKGELFLIVNFSKFHVYDWPLGMFHQKKSIVIFTAKILAEMKDLLRYLVFDKKSLSKVYLISD
jgi:hypothetical protein